MRHRYIFRPVPAVDPAPQNRWQRLPRALRDPWALLCFLAAAFLAWHNLHATYGDLGIYLDCAREMMQGGIDLYRARETGTGAYAYPHAALLPLVALQALLPDQGVRFVHALGMGVATAMIARDLQAGARLLGGMRWWQWLALAFLFHRCIAQNLTHGQLSLWIGAFALRGCLRLAQGRDLAAGIWLGLSCLKLTPLLFLAALPLMRRLRAALSCALTVAVIVLLLPWPVLGTENHLFQLRCFWHAVLEPLLGGGDLAVVNYHAGPSVAGTFDYLLQARPLDKDGHTVNLVNLSDGALRAFKLGWSLLLASILGAAWWRARGIATAAAVLLRCSLVLLAMSLLAPLTRVYHLAAVMLPALLFCTGPRRRDWLWWLTAFALAFSMPLRQKNLVGTTLWRALDDYGTLHFALVGLCVWLVCNADLLVAAPGLERQECEGAASA